MGWFFHLHLQCIPQLLYHRMSKLAFEGEFRCKSKDIIFHDLNLNLERFPKSQNWLGICFHFGVLDCLGGHDGLFEVGRFFWCKFWIYFKHFTDYFGFFCFFNEIFVRKKSKLGQSINNHLWCWAWWPLTLTSKHENCFSEQFLFSCYESSTFNYIKKIQCNCVVLIIQIKIGLKFCKLFSICLPCQSAKHAACLKSCLGLPFRCIFARISISLLEFSWWNV